MEAVADRADHVIVCPGSRIIQQQQQFADQVERQGEGDDIPQPAGFTP